MPIIANFKAHVDRPAKNSVCLFTVISINNEKQSGDNFKAFLSLLNEKYANQVNKLIIVVSGALHLHYTKLNKNLTEAQALQLVEHMDSNWTNTIQEILDNINFPYEIITWNELPKNKEYQEFFDRIKDYYSSKDKEFKCKVDLHSGAYYAEKLYKRFQEKFLDVKLIDCEKAAINYVLEECAMLVILNQLADCLFYPGKMNPCAKHIYENYLSKEGNVLKYYEYSLIFKKESHKDTIRDVDNSVPANKRGLFLDYSSNKEVEKHILYPAKFLLKTSERYKKMRFIYGFNHLIKEINNMEIKRSCQRRFSF